MVDAIAHSEGLPNTDELDMMLADLSFSPVVDEIIGEMPLEPEADEVIEVVAEEVIEPITEVVVEASPATIDDLADLDSLLAIEIVPAVIDENLSDEETRVLDHAIAKAEAYETQGNESEVVMSAEGDDEIEPAPAAVVGKPKKVKAAKAPAAPRVSKDISTLDAAHFQVFDAIAGDDTLKADVIAKRPKQVKIAEKFDNLIASLAAGRRPSTYVMDCFEVLDARKEVLGSDLVAALQAHDYTIGTSRSQAGQVMELFNVLGIADRVGQKLTLCGHSVFAAKLRALPPA